MSDERLTERMRAALDRVDAYRLEWLSRMRDESDDQWLRDHEVAILVAAVKPPRRTKRIDWSDVVVDEGDESP